MPDLNEEIVQVQVEDSTIITVPIDDTLSIAGQAADAAAVGEALQNVRPQVTVDGQTSDAQGVILLYAGHIPVSGDENAKKVGEVLAELQGMTAADLPMSGDAGAESVADAVGALQELTADGLPMSGENSTTVKAVLDAMWPVGSVWITTGSAAPSFFGTWEEIKVTMTWAQLKAGERGYTAGTSSGSVHFWRRTA